MRNRLAAFLALALPACSASSAPSAEFIELGGLGNFAMVIDKTVDADRLPELAKDKCGSREICTVLAWNSKLEAARAMPMTDAEAAKEVFSYAVNRNTGFERSLWNCKVYLNLTPDKCLATFEPGEQ